MGAICADVALAGFFEIACLAWPITPASIGVHNSSGKRIAVGFLTVPRLCESRASSSTCVAANLLRKPASRIVGGVLHAARTL